MGEEGVVVGELHVAVEDDRQEQIHREREDDEALEQVRQGPAADREQDDEEHQVVEAVAIADLNVTRAVIEERRQRGGEDRDPQRAAQLLDDAGWKDSNGDGIRDKDGMPFRFEMLASTSSTLVALLPILKEEMRKVGKT